MVWRPPPVLPSPQFQVNNNMDDVLLEAVSVKLDCDVDGLVAETHPQGGWMALHQESGRGDKLFQSR